MSELRCPRFGAGIEALVYVEQVTAERDVLGLDADGRLWISGHESIASEDPGEDGHLECRARGEHGLLCLGRVELPEGVEIEWE